MKMKKWEKLFLLIVYFLSLFSLALWAGLYYVGGLYYIYHGSYVVHRICDYFAVGILTLAVFVAPVIILKRLKKKLLIRVLCVVLMVVLFGLATVQSFVFLVNCSILGSCGCSYTDDIANYGKYDKWFDIAHFPTEITEDMTVVDFVYYYKYADIDQVDIYLEVKFDDTATMEKYLTTAINSFGEYGTISYPNPYNAKYTDVIRDRVVTYTKGENLAARIEFNEGDTWRYVDMKYSCITYSYEELTIIYNRTVVGNDIGVGNDPNRGEYYPRFLQRFGVEWDPDKNFRYQIDE